MTLKQEDYQQHISGRFNSELESLRNHMLEMGGKVENQLKSALDAVVMLDSGEAELVVARDNEVNQMEMAIDDECATIIARRQPTASDLRLVIAIIKVNTDLERIGDEAAKVAKQVIRITEAGASPSSCVELKHIGNRVADMLQQSLDAFARLDVEQAIAVLKRDREVDKEYGSAMRSLVTFMMEDPRAISSILNEMWALRSLERIGDHACNIAERVIYLVKGHDVRHGRLEELADIADEI
ncbi:MAG: phosphate signaling complex protein PhoU [Gammaproteobacteria bacterium]|nr:phosphate signaling complex protein PhoU [Gammaproteobacteria bacterium]